MSTKEKVKIEIENLPDDVLEQVYQFINSLKTKKKSHHKLRTVNLNGQFDDVNIREQAYE